jgi:hypothetical protein
MHRVWGLKGCAAPRLLARVGGGVALVGAGIVLASPLLVTARDAVTPSLDVRVDGDRITVRNVGGGVATLSNAYFDSPRVAMVGGPLEVALGPSSPLRVVHDDTLSCWDTPRKVVSGESALTLAIVAAEADSDALVAALNENRVGLTLQYTYSVPLLPWTWWEERRFVPLPL